MIKEGVIMVLHILEGIFSICKIKDVRNINWDSKYIFLGKTDDEISLVCDAREVPSNATDIDNDWKGFRVAGELEFSLIGIIAKISAILSDNNISIFVVSTYNTDYIFVKSKDFDCAINILIVNGYTFI